MTSKRIFILGATGPLGIYLCQEALKRGHSLTIYARNPSKLPKDVSENTNVKVVKGQINDHELLSSAIRGCEVVFSALGPNVSVSNLYIKPGTYTNTYRAIFKAMRDTGAKRIFIMGTPSIRTAEDKPPLSAKVAVSALRLALNSVYREVVATGKLLDDEAQGLDWTMYRVGNLSNGTGLMKAANYVGEGDWSLTTYRPDVAIWVVDQIEKEPAEWVHKKPALHSAKSVAGI